MMAMMASQFTAVASLVLVLLASCALGQDFCYRDEEGCGPNTAAWTGQCRTGSRQSPIDLPLSLPWGVIRLNLRNYRGSNFRIQNSGHSVAIDFGNQGPSTGIFAFPDPLAVHNAPGAQQVRPYKFSGAHFHWGRTDQRGSEHCVGGFCGTMELHLVHYSANYSSQKAAVDSGDPNALTVLGLIIDATKISQLGNWIERAYNLNVNHRSTGPLAPIVNHLKEIHTANHEEWTTVNEPLDFTPMLSNGLPSEVFTYKGSLTTPGCNEQVNWFVLKNRGYVSHEDAQAFRDDLADLRGTTLSENHRPLQNRNGRPVLLSTVVPV